MTLNLPFYVNLLGKSEDHLLNVSDADCDVYLRRALSGLHAVTGCDSVRSSDERKLNDLDCCKPRLVLFYKFVFA